MGVVNYLGAAVLAGGVAYGAYNVFAQFETDAYRLSALEKNRASLVQQLSDCGNKLGELVQLPAVTYVNCEIGGTGLDGRKIKKIQDSQACYAGENAKENQMKADYETRLKTCQAMLANAPKAKENLAAKDAKRQSLLSDLNACHAKLGEPAAADDPAANILNEDCMSLNLLARSGSTCLGAKINAADRMIGIYTPQLKDCNERIETQVAESQAAYDEYVANLAKLSALKSSLLSCESEKKTSSFFSSADISGGGLTKYSGRDALQAANQSSVALAAQLNAQIAVCASTPVAPPPEPVVAVEEPPVPIYIQPVAPPPPAPVVYRGRFPAQVTPPPNPLLLLRGRSAR